MQNAVNAISFMMWRRMCYERVENKREPRSSAKEIATRFLSRDFQPCSRGTSSESTCRFQRPTIPSAPLRDFENRLRKEFLRNSKTSLGISVDIASLKCTHSFTLRVKGCYLRQPSKLMCIVRTTFTRITSFSQTTTPTS